MTTANHLLQNITLPAQTPEAYNPGVCLSLQGTLEISGGNKPLTNPNIDNCSDCRVVIRLSQSEQGGTVIGGGYAL
jgi:hypothetical protein